MGIDDQAKNAAGKNIGAAKEETGKLTGDEDLANEGRKDQAKANMKEAGEKAKETASDIGGNIKAAARKLKEGFSNK